jgi:single stranded DNA-binding protein
LNPDTTLIAVIEMSQSSWLVAGIVPGIERQPLKKLDVDKDALLKLLHRWRDEAVGLDAISHASRLPTKLAVTAFGWRVGSERRISKLMLFKSNHVTGRTSIKQFRGGNIRVSSVMRPTKAKPPNQRRLTQQRKDTAVRGIEAAFWGVLGKDPELKTSKTGKAFATMNVVVTVGEADDGKDVSQWVRVACFGETAERIASRAKKGDRLYVEGTLTLNTWADKTTGEAKSGLNLAAFKCEKVSSIGKSRPRQDHGQTHTTQKTSSEPRHEFDDAIPF